MTPDEAAARLRAYPEVRETETWGERAFFVNPGGRLARGAYFATIKTADGPDDRASALSRPGVWRLNFGARRPDCVARFGPPPPRPAKGGTVEGPWDFTALDRPTPHPICGWMGWIAVLTPSPETFAALLPALDGAHARALATAEKRLG